MLLSYTQSSAFCVVVNQQNNANLYVQLCVYVEWIRQSEAFEYIVLCCNHEIKLFVLTLFLIIDYPINTIILKLNFCTSAKLTQNLVGGGQFSVLLSLTTTGASSGLQLRE